MNCATLRQPFVIRFTSYNQLLRQLGYLLRVNEFLAKICNVLSEITTLDALNQRISDVPSHRYRQSSLPASSSSDRSHPPSITIRVFDCHYFDWTKRILVKRQRRHNRWIHFVHKWNWTLSVDLFSSSCSPYSRGVHMTRVASFFFHFF